MELLLRFICTGALLLALAAYAQNSPPAAPAPGRAVPTSPEAAPSTPHNRTRTIPPPAESPSVERRQMDAEHQAARARCEAHPEVRREACLREADASYERAMAREHARPVTGEGIEEAGLH